MPGTSSRLRNVADPEAKTLASSLVASPRCQKAMVKSLMPSQVEPGSTYEVTVPVSSMLALVKRSGPYVASGRWRGCRGDVLRIAVQRGQSTGWAW